MVIVRSNLPGLMDIQAMDRDRPLGKVGFLSFCWKLISVGSCHFFLYM